MISVDFVLSELIAIQSRSESQINWAQIKCGLEKVTSERFQFHSAFSYDELLTINQ